MNLSKAQTRDRKRAKRKYGMRVDGKGAFTSQEEAKKRAEKIRKEREEKERLKLGIDNVT